MATTQGIRVDVRAQYLAERSEPEANQYVFAYTITISNEAGQPAQLMSRHWVITDAHNRVEEVRGDGVVGMQPRLAPGESFTYTSGCVLKTAHGTMHGTYRMVRPNGESFEAEIEPFLLAHPNALN
jgi:ApaG protein